MIRANSAFTNVDNPSLMKLRDAAPTIGPSHVPPPPKRAMRTISIENIDYQPCGGTHVKSTGEIGEVVIGKIKNKGKQNKRISLSLVNP